MDDDSSAIRQRERGRATVRALYLSELQDIKRRRSAALREVETQLDRLARLLPLATDAGITLSEISVTVQVSRPTLYQLRARNAGSSYEMKLALLQSIANFGQTRRSELEDVIKAEADHVGPGLDSMLEEGLVTEAFNEDSDDPAMEIALTEKGFDTLERWDLAETVCEDEVAE